MKLEKLNNGEFKPTLKEASDMIKLAYGRGTRQRVKDKLKKLGFWKSEEAQKKNNEDLKVNKDFVQKRKKDINQLKEENVTKEEQKKANKKKWQEREQLRKRMPDEERQIFKQVKNRKKLKRQAGNTDELDTIEQSFIDKKKKAPKWFG